MTSPARARWISLCTSAGEVGEAELTLDLPCAPEITQPEEDEELDLDSVEIIWSHTEGILDPDDLVEDEDPADACDDAEDVELVSFHVVVEYEYEDAGGEEILRVYAVDMEPEITQPEEDEELDLDSVEIIWSHTEGILDPDDLVEDEDPADACDDEEDVELVSFHVVVEYEFTVGEGEDEEEILRVYAVDMGPDATSLTVPEEFLAEGVEEGAEFKVEILAIEESGNRTITEVEFGVIDE